MNIKSRVRLANGIKIPLLGLGVFKVKEGKDVENTVITALNNGYRCIDTAQAYHNEEGVGRGIKASGIPREDIFLITKVENNHQGYINTYKAFYKSLEHLQTDYIDLYLIHWPKGRKSVETWKAMEELYKKGLIRAIGVSNFKIHHLEYLLPHCNVIPLVNQVEFNPHHAQPQLYNYCKSKNIQLQAWGPLMEGKIVKIPEIIELSKKYNKTAAQIVLRWDLQKGVCTIPKSVKPERIAANADIFDFQITDYDMQLIDSLNIDNPRRHHQDKFMFLLEALFKKPTFSLFKIFVKASIFKFKNRFRLPVS